MTPEQLDLVFSSDVRPTGHWSAPAMIVRHLGTIVPDLKLLELGTGYGSQMPFVLPTIASVTSIDAMYDWVPDLKEDDKFETRLIDQKKIDTWQANVAPWKEKTVLLIGSTHEIHSTMEKTLFGLGPFDILIVDACHHPVSAVEADFWNYRKFMAPECFIIFDDMQSDDPRTARDNVALKLSTDNCLLHQRDIANDGITATLMYIRNS